LNKIKVAAVNYLNTKPLLYGIKNHRVMNDIELYEAYPAMVAQMLLEGSADVGLIPVAVIPELAESHIITDYCIGCNGAVASVCIFSEVPMENITRVYLDYQSRTSVMLAKILLKEYWKSNAELIHATEESFIHNIKDTTAALIVGDRALIQRQRSPYIYDLGEAWKSHTGLPFVFAAWVSNKRLNNYFTNAFNEANGTGLQCINEVAALNKFNDFDLKRYYTKYIHYELNDEKRSGMDLFIKKLL